MASLQNHTPATIQMFLELIYGYEPGLYDKIKREVCYRFRDRKELKSAVHKWGYWNRDVLLKVYGHISVWDTSMITDMGHLFYNKRGFNDNING